MGAPVFKLRGCLPMMAVRAAVDVLAAYTGRFADIGCGNGVLLNEIKGLNNKKIFGVDILWYQVVEARKTGMPVVQADIFKMPFKDCTFDAAVCLNTIYNFPSFQSFLPALNEISRTLTGDGVILLDIRNKRNIFLSCKYYLHMKRKKLRTISYHPEEIEKIMAHAGFKLVTMNTVGPDNVFLALGYIMVFKKYHSTHTNCQSTR